MSMGPEQDTEQWKDQVDTITKMCGLAKTKKEMESMVVMFILDESYSRSAITYGMHNVEVEKGWK